MSDKADEAPIQMPQLKSSDKACPLQNGHITGWTRTAAQRGENSAWRRLLQRVGRLAAVMCRLGKAEGVLLLAAFTCMSFRESSVETILQGCRGGPMFGLFDLEGLGRDKPLRLIPRKPCLAFWAHLDHSLGTLFSLLGLPHISQVPIPTGSVSNQVSVRKGYDKWISMEDWGDNELKGSLHSLQEHLHFNRGLW